jgi:diguanylate cyclase (GGDEF)-like protein
MVREDLADVLSEFARTMVTDFPIQGILDQLVKRIVEIMPVSAAGVTLITPGLDPRYVAASNDSALQFERLQTELGEGPCLAAYHSGDPIAVSDLRLEQRFPRFAAHALEAGLMAVFAFPMRHEEVALGALDLYRDTPGELPPDAMSAAQTLAEVAAAYLMNAQARADLQDFSAESRDVAVHDQLTGLPNRVLMSERLDHAILRARRTGKQSAVFFVDLDHFKAVNDMHGHQVGEELMVAVAERLTGVLRPGDTLARLHGDEFVILCEDLDDPNHADELAVRIDAEMARPFVLSPGKVQIGASVGVAFSGRGKDAPGELIRDADQAMYQAKHHDGAAANVLDLRKLHLAEHQAGLAHALPGALPRGELHLVYQPIVDAVDGRLSGLEALLRWTHPTRGPVAPSVFIPYAERSGQIIEIGQWVLEHAWRDHKRWQAQQPDLSVSVNVSGHQLISGGFAATVTALLDATRFDPALLTLEVTETIFLGDNPHVLTVLDELKRLGVKLAIDDFGTGYSSLGHLTGLPFDSVKLEQTFTAELAPARAGPAVVTAVVELGHTLGMTIIAEGVETAEQHHQLSALGCDYCQGIYFAGPMPAEAIDALIQSQTSSGDYRLPVRVAPTGHSQSAASC